MNQGKLEVGKQEMARVNVNILEISELKWTGMGEFNSDAHYIYYLQEIFPTQGLNPGLLHCRQTLYRLNHWGSPKVMKPVFN